MQQATGIKSGLNLGVFQRSLFKKGDHFGLLNRWVKYIWQCYFQEVILANFTVQPGMLKLMSACITVAIGIDIGSGYWATAKTGFTQAYILACFSSEEYFNK